MAFKKISRLTVRGRILRKIREMRRSGKSLTESIYLASRAETERKGIFPPDNNEYSPEYFSSIKEKVYPKRFGKKFRPIAFFRRKFLIKTRGALAKKAFATGRFGIIVVKPELFAHHRDVSKFIQELGCKLLYSKSVVMSPAQVEDIYSAEMKRWEDFPINVGIYTTAPSKIIIFEHAPIDTYIKLFSNTDPKRFQKVRDALPRLSPQEVFQLAVKGQFDEGLPGTLRGETTHKRLASAGFNDMSMESKAIDVTGYLSHKSRMGKSVYNIITGVHTPSSISDLINHAISFFTPSELKKIIKMQNLH